MKKFLFGLLLIICAVGVYFYRDKIVSIMVKNIVQFDEDNLEYKNSYYLKYKFNYVTSVDDIENFELENYKDLSNLYYTIINNGNDRFDFACPFEYKNCLNDVKNLAGNPQELSTINGYVHPYNSFDTIKMNYDSLGRVKLVIDKIYDNNTIALLNEKVEEIVKNEVKDEKDTKKIIRIIHDYIINHTKYDKERSDKNIINYQSSTAYGVLYEGYGICSGYADAMAIFLDYYEIPNFKVASENHVWNAVNLDGKWYHLDLTWDDPIMSNNEEVLDDTYFLITTEELKKLNDDQHHFDETIYSELAE